MTARMKSAKALGPASLLLLAALCIPAVAAATDSPLRTSAETLPADQDAWRRGATGSIQPVIEEIEHPAEILSMVPKVLHAKKSWGALKHDYRR